MSLSLLEIRTTVGSRSTMELVWVKAGVGGVVEARLVVGLILDGVTLVFFCRELVILLDPELLVFLPLIGFL